MRLPTAIPSLPGRVNPGEPVRSDDWNRLLGVVTALLAARAPVRPDRPDPARAVMLAEALLLGIVDELKPPADEGAAGWPSETKYVFRAVHAPGIVLGVPGDGGAGVTPDYGRPVLDDEAKVYPQRVGSPVLLIRQRDPGSPGGVRTYSCVIGEVVARRRCTGGNR